MRNLKKTAFAAAATIILASCGGSISKQPSTAAGFGEIEKEMKSKFGDNAYYTDLTISYDKAIGNMVNTTVTDKPESLEMGEWTCISGSWTQSSEITLTVSEGSKAEDFMFQLGSDINLATLGGLIESSKKLLTEEKSIENPALDMAFIDFPNDGDIDKAEYRVMLEPENGGTTFSFYYQLDGELIKMD